MASITDSRDYDKLAFGRTGTGRRVGKDAVAAGALQRVLLKRNTPSLVGPNPGVAEPQAPPGTSVIGVQALFEP